LRILLYAPSGFDTIGGGRRVSAELAAAFLDLGHPTVVWTLHPGPTLSATESEAVPEHVTGFGPPEGTRSLQHAARKLEKLLAERGVELVLFGSEFSYMEFRGSIGRRLRWPRGPIRAALIHDQLWNGDPRAMTLQPRGGEAVSLAAALPYTRIRRSYEVEVERLRSLVGEVARAGPTPLAAWYKRNTVWRGAREARARWRATRDIVRRKRAVRELDLIFNLTERARRESAAAYGLSPGRVACAFGAPISRDSAPAARDFRRESASEGRKVVLSFARMAPEKYHEITLLAFARLLADGPDAVLWLAGQVVDSQRGHLDFLRAAARTLGIEDRVRFLGTCSEPEMLALYRSADCFICAQPADFNLSVLAALRAGLPVVVADTYDFPEALRSTGLIYSGPATAADFAARLRGALASDASRRNDSDLATAFDMRSYARSIVEAAARLRSA